MKQWIKNILIWCMTVVARLVIARKSPKVIVVIGSVGKTSTKNAIYTMIGTTMHVLKSSDTASSNLSALYALLGVATGSNRTKDMLHALMSGLDSLVFGGDYPEYIVLELSAKKKGTIKKISKWLRPYIVVMTRFPDIPAHVEYFKNAQELIEEKTSIARSLRKDGALILNADDVNVLAQKDILKSKTFTYGFTDGATIHGSNLQVLAPTLESSGGITFKANFDEKSFPVMLNNIYSEEYAGIALASLAVGYALEINMVDAIARLLEYVTPEGRARLHFLSSGVTIIDDSYDSSPIACESALKMLERIPFGKRKIAVLGDMLGLGRFTVSAHEHIGKLSYEYADILVTCGLRAKKIADGARTTRMSQKKIFETETVDEAKEIVKKNAKAGDVILIKGAHSMHLGKITDALK